ncbi:MAG TPA: C-type lectin domain-containing protein [Kofleriaceae bacterium]
MRVGLTLLLLASCDQTWNLDHIDERDAAPHAFDPAADCPTSYDLAFIAGSRFHIVQTGRTAWNASDACVADSSGLTHLAVAPTREELDALIGALTSRADGRWWIGAVQPTTATAPGDGWLWATGEAIDAALWLSPIEPNDGNGIEDDHEDQFGFIEASTTGLIDAQGLTVLRYLCQCDGRPMSNDARTALDQSRL